MITCTQLSCQEHPQELRGNLSIQDFALYGLSFAPFKQVPKILEPTLQSELIHFTTPFFLLLFLYLHLHFKNEKKIKLRKFM